MSDPRPDNLTRQSGSVLPLILILLTIMTATAVSVQRTDLANTRLTASVIASLNTFRLADETTAAALQQVRAQPSLLPAAGLRALPKQQTATGTAKTTLHFVATSTACPAPVMPAAERIDYEIRVTASGSRGTVSHHRQGFYICREPCPTPPCTGIETPAESTYWYVTRPAKN